MSPSITFFPVDCGDMTLIQLADGTSIVVDINIRKAADDDSQEDYPDVATPFRDKLRKDENGRPYVDAFLLSHPDQDHCKGLKTHFHLGSLDDYADDEKGESDKRIVINEMWSSPLVFKRASKKAEEEGYTLCDDAQAWSTEARRRARLNKEKSLSTVGRGDRILILGEDENGKTDDLQHVLVKPGEVFSKIDGSASSYFEAILLAPLPKGDEADEQEFSKNDSSIVIRFEIAANSNSKDGCKFLTGGDAMVGIWRRLWNEYSSNTSALEYDLLQAPHHCSWGVLSEDSWSKGGKNKAVDSDALDALSQASDGAFIVASSKPVKEDDGDPPCIGAKNEYVKITDRVDGEFYCTGEYPSEKEPEPLEFKVTAEGPQPPAKKDVGKAAAAISVAAKRPHEHG